MAIGLFDDGHVDGVVREQDFADVAEQAADCRLVIRSAFALQLRRDR